MGKAPERTPVEALSANILDTRFEDFDEATLDNARSRIIDVVGCAVGGANAVGNQALVNLVREWSGKPEASILVHGGKVPAHNAAMVNSIMARSFDYEALTPLIDGVLVGGHISGTTVMTALTLGEMTGCRGKELITALLVGDDTAIRVLGASGFALKRGWCNTGTVNQIGATAVAGRLLGLDRRQMRNAFGIVLSQMAGSLQNVWDGTVAFKLPQGLSARNGIFSAQLARAGWTGPPDALLSRFGYFNLYTGGCGNPEILTRDLGKTYYTESIFKPYPCCRGTHASIDCALALIRKHDIRVEDIEEAVIYLPAPEMQAFMGQPFKIGEVPHANAAFSCRYTTACALLRGSVTPEHFSEESIRDPRIAALDKKIKVAELPGAKDFSARLVLKMKDGRELAEFTDAPWGDALKNPMTREDIIEKFYGNIAHSKTITEDKARQLLDLLENLEEVDDVRRVAGLLVP
jgi:2-methylcitrate dehydratase PrpD